MIVETPINTKMIRLIVNPGKVENQSPKTPVAKNENVKSFLAENLSAIAPPIKYDIVATVA